MREGVVLDPISLNVSRPNHSVTIMIPTPPIAGIAIADPVSVGRSTVGISR